MNLPQPFISRMQQLLGEEYVAFEEALTTAMQPVSIRVNVVKGALLPAQSSLVPWSGGVGCYLSQRPTFTFDPLFHAGAYYVQEAASMFIGAVIKQYIDTPVRYLDLCAAPGGKSTHAHSLLPQGSLVVSNEYVRQRAQILAENIAKWGSPYAVVTNNTPADWGTWSDYFDVIAADVPCSGEGMFRKDETAIAEWSPQNVALCAARQEEIIADVWSALRPGGLFIYSTCTYNVEENEAMVQHIVEQYGAELLPVSINPEWGISGAIAGDATVYRFLPHRTRGEGLFMAVLRKCGEKHSGCGVPPRTRNKKSKQATKSGKPFPVPREVKDWVTVPGNYCWVADDLSITAYPEAYAADMQVMQGCFNVLHMALPVASRKGHDIVPSHALALSTAFNASSFACCELTLDVALSYLRREAITLPADVARGYVALTYQGFVIGWVKNLGNRANNLYPQEWRIRSPHNPQEIITAGVEKG